MSFGQTLQQLRGQAGLTQAALAEASGLSLGAIRDYEQGKKEPSLRSAARLARALDVPLDSFVTDGEPAPSAAKPHAGKPRSKAAAKGMPPPQHKPKARQARRPRGG